MYLVNQRKLNSKPRNLVEKGGFLIPNNNSSVSIHSKMCLFYTCMNPEGIKIENSGHLERIIELMSFDSKLCAINMFPNRKPPSSFLNMEGFSMVVGLSNNSSKIKETSLGKIHNDQKLIFYLLDDNKFKQISSQYNSGGSIEYFKSEGKGFTSIPFFKLNLR
jgi:hypothetical protein